MTETASVEISQARRKGRAITDAQREIATRAQAPLPELAPRISGPFALLQAASTREGVTPDTLDKFLALYREAEAIEQRRAFDAAFAAAKAEFTPILKNRTVEFESERTNKVTSYKFADIAAIAEAVDPILAKHGLSYRWKPEQLADRISITCIVAHRDGHRELTTLHAGADTSGKKNNIQSIGSTQKYLERYTLEAALGLAIAAGDDDGAAVGEPLETISEEQGNRLRVMLDECGFDVAKFCKTFGFASLAEIPADAFDKAVAQIEKARAIKAKQEKEAGTKEGAANE